MKSMLIGQKETVNAGSFGMPVVRLQSLGMYNVSQPHILIKPTKLTAKYLTTTSTPNKGLKRKLPGNQQETSKYKKMKLDKRSTPVKTIISSSLFGKKGGKTNATKKSSPVKKTSPVKKNTPVKKQSKSPPVKQVLSRAAAANKSFNESFNDSPPKRKQSSGKKVSFNNVLDVSYVSENGEIEREEKEEISIEGSSRRLEKDASMIENSEEIVDDEGTVEEDDTEIICDDEPDELIQAVSNLKAIEKDAADTSNESESSFHSAANEESGKVVENEKKQSVEADSTKNDCITDSVTSTTFEKDFESITEKEIGSGKNNASNEKNSSAIDEKTIVDDIINLISTTDKEIVNNIEMSIST